MKLTGIQPKLPSPQRLVIMLCIIKLASALFATLVFSRFSPLVDAQLYLQGFYAIDLHWRTRIVQHLANLANGVGGELFTHWVFGMVSCAGLLYYYLTGGKRWIVMLALLLPSAMVWTSIVGKEALFFGAFTLVLVVWSRFAISRLTLTDILALLGSSIVCAVLRPHYAVAIIWLFGSLALAKKLGGRAWPILAIAWCAAALIVYVYVWPDLLARGWGAIEPAARASRFVLFDMPPYTSEGFDKFKAWVVLGGIVGIVGPLPQEVVSRPEFLPFFVEGVLLLLFPPGICFYVLYCRPELKKEFLGKFFLCLAPAIVALMLLHAPFGLLNPGSATRWRVNFEAIFYLAPLLLLFRLEDAARCEDSAFSS